MPTYTHLITAHQLQNLMHSGQPLMVFDCSFDLMAPASGMQQYLDQHIPGAVYASLDAHLSAHGPAADGAAAASGGRHPLPNREQFARWLGNVGLRNDMQVIVYDRQGCNFCGRLWWMLKWAGHDAVAVLDGGLAHWTAAGGATASGATPACPATTFQLQPSLRQLVSAEDVHAALGQGQTVIDARAPARYRGDVEPLDPVAGHIPGALNRPFTENLALDGRFKPSDLLRAELDSLLQDHDPASVVHQCGSGVSAIPNVLAMELAGYAPVALFAGSWSEWCSNPLRPTAKG